MICFVASFALDDIFNCIGLGAENGMIIAIESRCDLYASLASQSSGKSFIPKE
jgi:hypothetical protein